MSSGDPLLGGGKRKVKKRKKDKAPVVSTSETAAGPGISSFFTGNTNPFPAAFSQTTPPSGYTAIPPSSGSQPSRERVPTPQSVSLSPEPSPPLQRTHDLLQGSPLLGPGTSASEAGTPVSPQENQQDNLWLLNTRDAEGRLVVEPLGNGIEPTEGSNLYTACIQNFWTRGWSTWKQFPNRNKGYIFDRKKCCWNPIYNAQMERNMDLVAKSRIRSMVYNARKSKPGYMREEVVLELQEKRKKPGLKEKSEQCKKNRKSEKGGSLHAMGRMSMAKLAKKMNAFQESFKEYTSSQDESLVEASQRYWIDTIGGSYKGRCYGLGSNHPFAGHISTFEGASSSSSQPDNSQLQAMQQQMEQQMEHQVRSLSESYNQQVFGLKEEIKTLQDKNNSLEQKSVLRSKSLRGFLQLRTLNCKLNYKLKVFNLNKL